MQKGEFAMMKYRTALKVLTDRAENFYGRDLEWLIKDMVKELRAVGYTNETIKVNKAFTVVTGIKTQDTKGFIS